MEVVIETALSNDVFTPKHRDISQEFLSKVRGLLSLPNIKPKTYAVDNEYQQRESIKVEINDKTTLEINLIMRM